MSNASVSANPARLQEATESLRSLSIKTLPTSEFAVDGKTPGVVARPTSPQEISESMSIAAEHRLTVSPLGGRTRTGLGNVPESLDIAIDVTAVDQVMAHNAADLTATVEAGIRVSRLQEVLAEHGQFLAIDPPLPDRATIGGTLAVGWSGPATWQNWSPRDIVIGMRTVQADGVITKTGGQVVKNVSGYDMARMHIGALGTLGVIVEVSFKLTPLPAPAGDRHGNVRLGRELPRRRAGGFQEAVSFASGNFHTARAAAKCREDVARVKHDLPSWSESEDGREAFGGRPTTLYRSSSDFGAISDAVIDGDEAAIMWRRIGDFGWDRRDRPNRGDKGLRAPGGYSPCTRIRYLMWEKIPA